MIPNQNVGTGPRKSVCLRLSHEGLSGSLCPPHPFTQSPRRPGTRPSPVALESHGLRTGQIAGVPWHQEPSVLHTELIFSVSPPEFPQPDPACFPVCSQQSPWPEAPSHTHTAATGCSESACLHSLQLLPIFGDLKPRRTVLCEPTVLSQQESGGL